jgi:peptide/nickel transport system substrate-binding protein/oligopeptide transport system substrate-binding protein
MNVRRLTAWVALPVAVAVVLSACGGNSDSGSGSGGGTVTADLGEPEHLVPSNTVESEGYQVVVALWAPLTRFDDKGKPVFDQAAAESITTSDNKVWTVKLRDGMTFHNGEKVTADSYINAWNYASYGPNAQVGTDFFSRIDGYADLQAASAGATPKSKTLTGLKKVDDNSFTVTLSEPFAEWVKVLGYGVFAPLPAAAFGSDGALVKGFEDAPIGDGPFKMKGSWNHNQNIAIERYDAYPLTKPHVQEINFKIYQSQETAYNDLLAGNLDVQRVIPPSKLSAAKTDLGDRFKSTPSSYLGFITVPSYIAAYAKPEFRKAISKAIDRDEIINKIFGGGYVKATSWVTPLVEGYQDNVCGDACVFDAAAAKTLWNQAGGVPGNKLPLYYNSDGGHKEWVDAVCNQLTKNLGVECVPSPVAQFADLRKQARAHTLQGLLRGAWSFDYPSIEDYLTPLYKTGASSNDSQYSNPTFDQTLTQADQSVSSADAIKKYQEAEAIIAKDMPTIPMWFRNNNFGYSTNMKTVQKDLFANLDVLTLERN